PDSIIAAFADDTLTVHIFVDGNSLTLSSSVILPEGGGPFPAVIGMGGPSGSLPSSIFSSRNIAMIPFNFGQVMAHTQTRGAEPINTLYPDLTYIGAYSAWSWGVSRLIDGLELVQNELPIDLKHLAVTGCSFAGKMALFAGAFDERIALTIAQESGGGGYTTWRVSETLGTVETLSRTSHAWFIEDMFQFSTAVSRLPHDHHELMAMVAPRALFVTGNPDYTWLADESGYVGSKAAKEVWKALGVSDRFGFGIVGGHMHCSVPSSQIPEIEAFVEKFLLGIDSVNTEIATSPYNTNLSTWIPWSTPTLENGDSFFGKASLTNPEDKQKDLETTLTLEWSKVDDAVLYSFQLASDSKFTTLIVNDSTTDNSKTITNLINGKTYYWRVQAKNAEGLYGPLSNPSSFSTYIPLPEIPQLVSAFAMPGRPDYVNLTWQNTHYADQYLVQIAVLEDFSRVFLSSSAADTTKNLRGTNEGQRYFWRVQAKNVAGSGPWSDTGVFTVIAAPTDLELVQSALNEITLQWRDESEVEDGFIIERKESSQSTFALIDTVAADAEEYIDTTVEPENTYTYRVRAYLGDGVSASSNETSLLTTALNDDGFSPSDYALSQNYPNPFNPSTRIAFSLPKTSPTKVVLYDLLGREIRTILNQMLEAGVHEIAIDAADLTSGTYIYKIQSGDFTQSKKMIVQR
ncbi:T9SS type A sorting domain-containing protein, partial [candidate division KSB1 bacterium]|nr:T9SS type A sorting domain-containing protein [candidate division KSB1 bacterium]